MTDLKVGIFGTPVTQVGDKGKGETDSGTLCDSKHEVWVYTTDFGNDGAVTPGADNIVVSFTPTDTAGTGCIGAIMDGSMKFITDPEEWRDTVGGGMDILQQNYNDCEGLGNCTGALLTAGVYAGAYGVTNTVAYVGQGAFSIGKSAYSGTKSVTKSIVCGDSWYNLCAEEGQHMAETNYSPVGNQMSAVLKREFHNEGVTESGQDCFDDFGGTVFHNSNGRGHKINISITCDGKSMYDTELAGSSDRTTIGKSMRFDPSLKQFKITKPGTWVVTVKSLASHAECATPTLNKSWTINVPKPADWDESAPVIETQSKEVKEVTAKVGKQLELVGFDDGVDPLTIFAGLALGGGILVWGILSLLGSSNSDSDEVDEE
jgi:hypothetical protein